MICPDAIDAAILADYWLSLLTASEEENVELHLFECDLCASRLREVIALADGIRNLARSGSLRMILSEAFLDQVAVDDVRIRKYSVPAGGAVECTVTAGDDLLVARLMANCTNAARVDLSLCDERGIEQVRMPDIPLQPGASHLIYHESITFAKAMPSNKMIARLIAFDEAGSETLISEYAFNHTRSMPGPAAW